MKKPRLSKKQKKIVKMVGIPLGIFGLMQIPLFKRIHPHGVIEYQSLMNKIPVLNRLGLNYENHDGLKLLKIGNRIIWSSGARFGKRFDVPVDKHIIGLDVLEKLPSEKVATRYSRYSLDDIVAY